jgi:pilus assembly protein Flp/PilA
MVSDCIFLGLLFHAALIFGEDSTGSSLSKASSARCLRNASWLHALAARRTEYVAHRQPFPSRLSGNVRRYAYVDGHSQDPPVHPNYQPQVGRGVPESGSAHNKEPGPTWHRVLRARPRHPTRLGSVPPVAGGSDREGGQCTANDQGDCQNTGATAIEYGLIAAGIAVAIIAVVQGLGTKLNSTFTSVSNALN